MALNGTEWHSHTRGDRKLTVPFSGSESIRRMFGTNVDVISRLDKSLSAHESLFQVRFPQGLYDFKQYLNREHGLKLSVSYQSLYQNASDTLSEMNSAWGGWILFQGAWTAFNRGKDHQGRLVFALDGRHTINPDSQASPGHFHFDVGSLWPTDSSFLEWDIYPAILFWEQWAREDRFAIRIGQQAVLSVIDSFRFDEFRSSFLNIRRCWPGERLAITGLEQ